jgi:hypothetical protein
MTPDCFSLEARAELQIPREVDEFVLACLSKNPKLRPASA